jgi:hypothetical protein
VTCCLSDSQLTRVRILNLPYRFQPLRCELARPFPALHPRRCSRREFVYTMPTPGTHVQEEKCFSVQCGAFLLWFFFALPCLALLCLLRLCPQNDSSCLSRRLLSICTYLIPRIRVVDVNCIRFTASSRSCVLEPVVGSRQRCSPVCIVHVNLTHVFPHPPMRILYASSSTAVHADDTIHPTSTRPPL